MPHPILFRRMPIAKPATGEPLDPNLRYWWRADSFLGQLDGASVGGVGLEWVDKASGLAMYQYGGASHRPTYQVNVAGSQPVVRFASASQQYLIGNDASVTGAFTFLVIGAITTYGNYSWMGSRVGGWRFRSYGDGTDYYPQLTLDTGAAQNFTVFAGNPQHTFHMLAFSWDTTTAYSQWNKSVVLSGALADTSITVSTIGCQTEGFYCLGGDIAEIRLYNVCKTGAQINSLYDTWLKPRYGLA